jgi:murein DD-endopeptidase MepM/ murein hydrolase activator NlpD
MQWRPRDRYVRNFNDYRSQLHISPWVKQSIICVFIFCLLLGASHANRGFARDVSVFVRGVVENDTSLEEVRAWAATLPNRLNDLAWFDIRNFWSKAVTGKQTELAWPCLGRVSSYFGWRPSTDSSGMTLHQGIDIEADIGTDVHSVLDGVVVSVRESPTYGLTVEIEHSGGLSSLYAHLESAVVKEEQKVERGQLVGTVGDSGNATGPHLHLEVRKDGIEIDPMTILPPLVTGP